MAGDEISQKEDKLRVLMRGKTEWNYKKIVMENSRAETISLVLEDSFMYLSTIDMFNDNPKVLYVVVENSKVAVEVLGELMECIGDNLLIIDIRSQDTRSLVSSSIYKKNSKRLCLDKFTKLEEKNRASTILEIKNMLKDNDIKFKTEADMNICIDYIYDNSNYSYTYIKQQVNQLKYFSDKTLSRDDIYEFITESFNGNYYALIKKIFNSENKESLIQVIESNFINFDKSDYISFLNIFINTIKDYLRYSNGVKCKNGANFYQFRDSKIKILEIGRFISEMSNLNFSCRNESCNIKEELLFLIWNHVQ